MNSFEMRRRQRVVRLQVYRPPATPPAKMNPLTETERTVRQPPTMKLYTVGHNVLALCLEALESGDLATRQTAARMLKSHIIGSEG